MAYLLEKTQTKYCLLYWFFQERNWSIQSQSTIMKPRRDDYRKGDIVVAKFQGKPYHAAVIAVEDEKDLMMDAKLKLEHLLKNMDLTPEMIMEGMGIENVDPMKAVAPTEQLTAKAGPSGLLGSAPVLVVPSPKKSVDRTTKSSTPLKNIRKEFISAEPTPPEQVDIVMSSHQHSTSVEKPNEDQASQHEATTSSYLKSHDDVSAPLSKSSIRIRKLEEEMKDVKAEVRSLKRKLRRIEEKMETDFSPSKEISSKVIPTPSADERTNTTLEDCVRCIEHLSPNTDREITDIIKKATLNLFSRDELVQYSRTGKKTVKSGETVRPRLDGEKFQILEKVVLQKCPTISQATFIKKFENIQKVERRKYSANH